MSQSLCDRFGFDDAGIAERLRLLGLASPRAPVIAAEFQSHVVEPNVDAILEEFYEPLGRHPQFLAVVRDASHVSHLKMTQRRYLLGLGRDFSSRGYFEERLRVGVAHQQAGVSLGLYQSFYCLLQNLLIAKIPDEIKARPDTFVELSQFIIRIAALDMSLAIEIYHSTEIRNLEHSIHTIRDEGELLRRTLQIDSLTRVCSRQFVLQELRERLDAARREQVPLSVLMADLDHFKRINDRHGHLVGDRILRDVATRMSTGARNSDVVGRYGGEEFLIIFDAAPLDVARELAERIRLRVMADPFVEQATELAVTVSLGVAQARDDDDVDSLTARADRAMYTAKRAGRNRVRTELDILRRFQSIRHDR